LYTYYAGAGIVYYAIRAGVVCWFGLITLSLVLPYDLTSPRLHLTTYILHIYLVPTYGLIPLLPERARLRDDYAR